MFFASTDSDPVRQADVLKSLWSHAVDGVIVFPALDTIEQLTGYARRGLPVVIVDDQAEAPNLACVYAPGSPRRPVMLPVELVVREST